MPRLRPPTGRQAAAAVIENPEPDNLNLENDEIIPPEDNPAEDPTVALKAQIEALKQSEQQAKDRAEAERVRAEEATKLAKLRDADLNRLQQESLNSQTEAIGAALAAAQAEAEAAQREIEDAIQMGDPKGQAEAYRKLSRAESKITRLEDGKEAIERQAKEAKEAPPPEPQQPDIIEQFNIPANAKAWLRAHKEYITDPRKNAKIQSLHWDLVDEGLAPYSDEYFVGMEQKLGMRQPPAPEPNMEDDDEPPVRRPNVSAPPSRDIPAANGRRTSQITLTKAQKEAAKIAGVTEAEYAKNLIRLNDEKSNGNYGGAP